MGKFGKRVQLVEIQNALKLADNDGDCQISHDELRTYLKQFVSSSLFVMSGFSSPPTQLPMIFTLSVIFRRDFVDGEIDMYLSKYDVNGDKQLSGTEVSKMMADLEGERKDIDQQITNEENGGCLSTNFISHEEYNL